MPVASAIASGEWAGSAMKARYSSASSQRSRTKLLVVETLGDDHVGHGVDKGDVGARQHGQVVGRLDVRAAYQVDAARVGDDQLGALAQPPLHPRGEDGVGVGGVGADQQDHVGLLDRLEVLRAGGGAEGLLEAVAGR